MSVTDPIAPPDAHRCPVCGAPVGTTRCGECFADLGGSVGRELWFIDHELFRLSQRRRQLIEFLRAPRPAAQTPPAPAMTPSFDPSAAGGPQVSSILLGLGVMLLVIAALVFAAVSWSRLGAAGQGALLVGLTLAAAAGTRHASRRGLSGTAEALGILTIVMGPLVAQAVRITIDLPDIDDRTWENLGVWSWWPAALVVIGVAAIGFGRTVDVRSPQVLGVLLVLLGPAIWVALAPLPLGFVSGLLALHAGLAAALPGSAGRHRPTDAVWAWGAAITWCLALLVGIADALTIDGSWTEHAGSTTALAACAIAAGAAAWRWRTRTASADIATIAAATATSLAIGRGLAGAVPDVTWWPAMGLVAAGGLVAADEIRHLRTSAVRVVSWLTAGVAALPLLVNGGAVLAAAGSFEETWHQTAWGRVDVDAIASLDPAWLSAALGLLALTAAVGARLRRLDRLHPEGQRRWAISGAAAFAGLAAVLVPPLAGATLGLVTSGALAAASILVAAAAWSGDRRVLPAGALAILGLGLLWAVGSQPLLLLVGGVALSLGAVGVLRGRETGDRALISAAGALTAVAVVGEAGVAAAALGAGDPWAWAVASMAAAIAGAALPHAEPGVLTTSTTASTAGAPARTVGAVLVAAHLWTLLSIESSSEVSATAPITAALVVGVLAFASIAARTRLASPRGWVWRTAAGAEALALLWFRLGEAEVDTPEAYLLPLAILLGASAWMAARSRGDDLASVASWHLEGPALAVAFGPTVLYALGDPGVTRQVFGLAVGALLIGAGATLRRRAPLDVGAVTVVVLGLQALLPYADQVPRWVSLGTVGVLLVAVGATFEQRRRDLREAKRHYSALR